MWAWKHVALLAGILGVCAVFAPMFEVKQGRLAVELSANQLSFGFERSRSIIDRDLPRAAEKYLPDAIRGARDDGRLIAKVSKWAALAYAPAALILLLGLIGILRRRFGRALGLAALLFGLASIATWVGLRFGMQIALKQADLEKTEVTLLFGAHLLLVVGVAGVVAGIGAIARPDRGPRSRMRPGPPGPPGPPGFTTLRGPGVGPPGPPPGFGPPSGPPPPVFPPPAA